MRMTSLRLEAIERERGMMDESEGLPVDEDDPLLDNAASADNDWPGDGKDGRFGVNYGACANGDVALEFDVLTDDGFGVDGELVAAERD